MAAQVPLLVPAPSGTNTLISGVSLNEYAEEEGFLEDLCAGFGVPMVEVDAAPAALVGTLIGRLLALREEAVVAGVEDLRVPVTVNGQHRFYMSAAGRDGQASQSEVARRTADVAEREALLAGDAVSRHEELLARFAARARPSMPSTPVLSPEDDLARGNTDAGVLSLSVGVCDSDSPAIRARKVFLPFFRPTPFHPLRLLFHRIPVGFQSGTTVLFSSLFLFPLYWPRVLAVLLKQR